jgi:hypothetical protein
MTDIKTTHRGRRATPWASRFWLQPSERHVTSATDVTRADARGPWSEAGFVISVTSVAIFG